MFPLMLKKLLLVLLTGVIVLTGIMTWNALRTESLQLKDIPAPVSIEIDEQKVVGRFANALQFETVSVVGREPNAPAFAAFHSFLMESFPLVFEQLELERINEWTLFFTWAGADPALKPVVLMGHQDVVPAENPERWTHPPFSGAIAEDRVWGRGAIDNKNIVMAVLETIELKLREGFVPERTIKLVFGHDEEIGGADGARVVAERLQERGIEPEFVLDEGGFITDDAFPVGAPIALVGTSEKGYVSLEIVARSQGGHSSAPPAKTAVGIVAKAVSKLQESLFPSAIRGATYDLFAFLTPEMPFSGRLIFSNLWLTEPLIKRMLRDNPQASAMLRTTIAPTMMSGSEADNVLPAEARIVVNFRILPGETTGSVKEHVRRVINDERVEVRPYAKTMVEPSPVSNPGSDAFRTVQSAVQQTFPDVIVAPFLMIAATDSRHFTGVSSNVFRFSPVHLTPAEGASFHAIDEHLTAETYVNMIRFYYQLLHNVAG